MRLSLQETAKLLDLPMGMVERWIRQGRIPINKIGEDCYFKKAVLEKWALTHNLSLSKMRADQQETEPITTVSLRSAMDFGGVSHQIQGKNIKEVLEAVVSRNTFLHETNKKLLLERLIERENLTSTGIGNGVAIPHPRVPLQEAIQQPAISTCFLEKPIDFQAMDGKPVFVLFLLISTSMKTHLHLLSGLSLCLRNSSFITFLHSRPDQNSLMERIAMFEHADSL